MHTHTHTHTQAHAHIPSLAAKFVGGKWYWNWRALLVIHCLNIPILQSFYTAVFTPCVFFLKFSQVESCWTLPSMAHLATLTQWSMRLVIVLGSTTCFEVYQRLNRVMMRVWRLSPQWRPEICVQTPIPLPNTKAATIPNQATKPVAVSTSRTRRLTTTWVTQVRFLKVVYVRRCVLFLSSQILNFWVGKWPGLPTLCLSDSFRKILSFRRIRYFPFTNWNSNLTPSTMPVSCRWCLYRLLYVEPGSKDALLPGSHLPDLATCLQASSSANGTPSGWAAS